MHPRRSVQEILVLSKSSKTSITFFSNILLLIGIKLIKSIIEETTSPFFCQFSGNLSLIVSNILLQESATLETFVPFRLSNSLAFSNHFFFTSTLNLSKESIPNKLIHTKTYVSFTDGINLVLIRYVLPHPHSPDNISAPTGLFISQ